MNSVDQDRVLSVLVTGAAGFIGKNIVAELLNQKHDVSVLLHRNELPQYMQDQCTHIYVSDICELENQDDMFENIDVVCHAAAYIPIDHSDDRSAIVAYHVNAQATMTLASVAKKHGVQRFIYLSAGNMYCPSTQPSKEDSPVELPSYGSNYFLSKFAGETYLNHVCLESEISAVILRIGTPYGNGEPAANVVPTFMANAVNNELLLIKGGDVNLNLVYIDDVVDCVLSAIHCPSEGVFNVASEERTTLQYLATSILEVYSESTSTCDVESILNKGYQAVATEKIRQVWGVTPCNLVDGLQKYRQILEKEKII